MHQKVCAAQQSLLTRRLVQALQSQPLDIFTSEVDTQRQNLPHLRWRQPPRQGARVRAPVIQDLGNLQQKQVQVSQCEAGSSVEAAHWVKRTG